MTLAMIAKEEKKMNSPDGETLARGGVRLRPDPLR
jgi:hypothetical protein